MLLRKAANFLGEYKYVLLAMLLVSCASKKELTPADRMKFLDKEIESSFTVRKVLKPSGNKTSRLKEGQWVSWSTHYKNKSQAPHYSTLRVVKVRNNRVTLEIETHTAGKEREHQFVYQLKGLPVQMQLGFDRSNLEKFKQKLNFEKISVRSGQEKSVDILPSKNASLDEFIFKFIFEGMRTSKMVAEKCETEFLQSSRCFAYDFEADRIKFRSKGRVWVHSAIPIMGVVRAEDESSVTRVIQFGETRK